MIRLCLALGLLTLAACGPLAGNGPLAGVGEAIRDQVAEGGAEPATPTDPRAVLTRQMIEDLPNDLLLVDVISRSATATLLKAGENGDRVTWVSPDGISVTVEEGLLVATRGFGFDLMAADVSGIRAVLNGASSGRYVAETLDGRDQVVREEFDCAAEERVADPVTIFERSYRTTRVLVLCEGATRSFGNRYWVDPAGVVWKSQQLVTPQTGYLGLEVL